MNALALLVLNSIYTLDVHLQESSRRTHANDYFRRLELRFESYVAAAKTLRDRTLRNGELSQESFERESSLIQNYFKGFQALNFVNPQGKLIWVTPLEGNEEALGRDLFKNPWVKDLLSTDQARQSFFLSPPLELYQGGRGLVIYFPLIKKREFKGWMNIVFRAEPLLGGILTSEEKRTHPLLIKDSQTQDLIYSDFQDANLQGETPYYYDFNLFGRGWSFGLTQKTESIIPKALRWSYAFIFVLSLVLAFVFKLYLDRWDEVKTNLEDALSEATLLKVLGHDLRSPLTMAELLIEKLERQTKNLPEAKAPLVEIKKLFSLQSEMLESVRNLQLFKRRKKEIFLGPVSLYHAFEHVKDVYQESLEHKDVTLRTNLEAESDYQILAHRTYFENNVLTNLVSNAIKYSPRGGEIFIQAQRQQDEIVIEVSDQGQGFHPEMRDRFHRGESLPSLKGTEGETGTGFGLLLVKNFVELLGGQVHIKSNLPRGSTFVLIFPKV